MKILKEIELPDPKVRYKDTKFGNQVDTSIKLKNISKMLDVYWKMCERDSTYIDFICENSEMINKSYM